MEYLIQEAVELSQLEHNSGYFTALLLPLFYFDVTNILFSTVFCQYSLDNKI